MSTPRTIRDILKALSVSSDGLRTSMDLDLWAMQRRYALDDLHARLSPSTVAAVVEALEHGTHTYETKLHQLERMEKCVHVLSLLNGTSPTAPRE